MNSREYAKPTIEIIIQKADLKMLDSDGPEYASGTGYGGCCYKR